ncbi:MAG: diaminopropionate ammonia-lyase [Acidobacteria bacterium]|nr:diaminopropionate ammonia-lyase [Acidobacteriota bacterium]
MTSRYHINAKSRTEKRTGLFTHEEYDRVRRFYDSHPAASPTPLHRLSALAETLGVGEIMVKDESARFNLPAFKIAGVWYAINELQRSGAIPADATLVCATSGNHGRATAHAARRLGLRARVYVPHDARPSRIEGIRGEGAEVVVTESSYNDAVRRAAAEAAQAGWTVISDTGYPGYEQIPRLIMAGYTRLCDEASRQWTEPPDVVLVQGGVGGLVCAAASWFAHHFGDRRPYFICCEPVEAACLMQSAEAGRLARARGNLETSMEGLRCSEPSASAWPTIDEIVDAFVAIDDQWSFQTMRRLAYPEPTDPKVVAGASGACGLASLAALLESDSLAPILAQSRITSSSRILVFNTEGATDPDLYHHITAS